MYTKAGSWVIFSWKNDNSVRTMKLASRDHMIFQCCKRCVVSRRIWRDGCKVGDFFLLSYSECFGSSSLWWYLSYARKGSQGWVKGCCRHAVRGAAMAAGYWGGVTGDSGRGWTRSWLESGHGWVLRWVNHRLRMSYSNGQVVAAETRCDQQQLRYLM